MTTIWLTRSITEAIVCVLELCKGTLSVRLQGTVDSPEKVTLEPPSWEGFKFFDRIQASDIVATERVKPVLGKEGSLKQKRTVEFFYNGYSVVIVDLLGERCDRNWEHDIYNWSSWAVARIGYFKSYSRKWNGSTTDWVVFQIEPEFKIGHSDIDEVWCG